jgi:HPt (histidine-containing phosphotransfer) domain-containing protein
MESSHAAERRNDGPAGDLPGTIRSLERADARLAVMEARLWAILDTGWESPTAGVAGDIDDAATAWGLKSELLALIGRDLRTPMEAVLGMPSEVLDGPAEREPDDRAETLRHSGDTLLRILEDAIVCGPVGDGPGTGEPPAAPRLDATVLDELRELGAGDAVPGFLDEIVWLFDTEVGPKVAALESAFAVGECDAVQRIAHEINGCAAQVGAAGVAAICRRIEVACAAGAPASNVSEVPRLRREFEHAQVALRMELCGPTPRGWAA